MPHACRCSRGIWIKTSLICFNFCISLAAGNDLDDLWRSLLGELFYSILKGHYEHRVSVITFLFLLFPSLWEYWCFLSKPTNFFKWKMILPFYLFICMFPICSNNFLQLFPNPYERYTGLRFKLHFLIDFQNTFYIQYPA